MQKIKKYILKYLLLIILFILLSRSAYYFSYLRYNNKKIINEEILSLENKYLHNENQALKDSLNINDENYKFNIVRVINRDIYNFYNEIVISNGKNTIQEGNAVVNEEGLIGVVSKVNKKDSVVKLLTGEYNVSVIVNDVYGNLNNGKIQLLDKYSKIKEGDYVYTSGLTDIPKGIYLGKVKSVNYDSTNLGQEVVVDLINNNDLNYVGIIGGIK